RGHHAATASDHVAEPDGAKPGSALFRLTHRLHDQLTDPLGGTKDIDRVGCLVTRDEDEYSNAPHRCKTAKLVCAQHVDTCCLGWMLLQQRHVLVSGCMKDDVWAMGGQQSS